MSFKFGSESTKRKREREIERERERERVADSQFDTAGGNEFQVRGAADMNDRLANDVQFLYAV